MRVLFFTFLIRSKTALMALFHYTTIINVLIAFGRGVARTFRAVIGYINAESKPELKTSNPTQHDKETARRRWLVYIGAGIWAAAWTVVMFRSPAFELRQHTISVGAVLALLFHIGLMIAIGRTDVLLAKVMTKKMMTESIILEIVDEITLPAKARADGYGSQISSPPARLASGKGQTVTVSVHGLGNPDLLINGAGVFAHKMGNRPATCVYTYAVKTSASDVHILVLDSDPYDEPPTRNPLVVSPRPFNVWAEKTDLGVLPDYTACLVRLAEEGDGGGLLVGAGPRQGKSVFISNVLVPLALCPTADIHIVDGSAIDFSPLAPICASYVGGEDLAGFPMLAKAHAVLKDLQREMGRRKPILFRLKTNKLNERIAIEYKLNTQWLVIDELAAITADLWNTETFPGSKVFGRTLVQPFLDDLQNLCANGPKYGIFTVLGTQRPNDKSVPPSIRDLITRRVAFYIASHTGGRQILDQAGPTWRADKLNPAQKGVGLMLGVGRFRPHLVEVPDLEIVAKAAATIRASHGHVMPTPSSTTQGEQTILVYPEPVATIIELMHGEELDVIESTQLVGLLQDSGFPKVTVESLAQSLKPWGIRPERKYLPDGRRRAYSLTDLEAVPKVAQQVPALPVPDNAQPGPGTGQDESGTAWRDEPDDEDQDGQGIAADVVQFSRAADRWSR